MDGAGERSAAALAQPEAPHPKKATAHASKDHFFPAIIGHADFGIGVLRGHAHSRKLVGGGLSSQPTRRLVPVWIRLLRLKHSTLSHCSEKQMMGKIEMLNGIMRRYQMSAGPGLKSHPSGGAVITPRDKL